LNANPAAEGARDAQRLDKWLWCARFFRTRADAARFCVEGRLRLAGRVVDRAHATVRPGDVLTFALGPRIRVVRIKTLPLRRLGAPAARDLYDDLSPARPDEER
jgi:ribosome-associated heat shock protein Hsp15